MDMERAWERVKVESELFPGKQEGQRGRGEHGTLKSFHLVLSHPRVAP